MRIVSILLEDCLYMGASLCSLYGVNTFGVRSVFSVDAFHLFPQFVLAVIPFIKGVTCGDQKPSLDVE